MRPPRIVVADPVPQSGPQRRAGLECMEVYTLVFQTAPQPLDEYIIHPLSPPVHRNAHTGLPQNAGKPRRGELAALVSVHNSGTLPSTRAPKSPFTIHITHTRTNAPRRSAGTGLVTRFILSLRDPTPRHSRFPSG